MNKKMWIAVAGLAVAVGVGALLFPTLRDMYVINQLVSKNVEARGGADAWSGVESLRYEGTMEIGQGLQVPYVLDQKRPGKMCLEYEFDEHTVAQCSDGERGWKRVPFKGKLDPQPMTDDEVRMASDGADPRGLLFDHRSRGHAVSVGPAQQLDGQDVNVLKVTLPSGSEREVYLDPASGLELMVVASRTVAKKERRVETRFSDWKMVNGLLIPHKQVTQTVGDDEAHALMVKSVDVNPPVDDARFEMPSS